MFETMKVNARALFIPRTLFILLLLEYLYYYLLYIEY